MSILSRALAHRRAHPFGQFGQSDDELSNHGATGCTDTTLQFLARLLKSVAYSHNQIRRRVGHGNRYTGLNSNEVGAWFRSVRLPYVVKFNLTASQMLSLSRSRGPVLFGELYGWHPEWRGYTYSGVKADGRPNGFARPAYKAGKNQLRGFTGRHAAVLLGYTDSDHVYVFEPNHNSSGRPENVAYDVITIAQFKALIASWKRSTGNTYCAYPTKALS
jgi:hypothetical protein